MINIYDKNTLYSAIVLCYNDSGLFLPENKLKKECGMMKKGFLFLLCLTLVLMLAACQPQTIELLTDDSPSLINVPTSVPGEPQDIPAGEING